MMPPSGETNTYIPKQRTFSIDVLSKLDGREQNYIDYLTPFKIKTSSFLSFRPHWASVPHFLWAACEIYGRQNLHLRCSSTNPTTFKGVKQEFTLDRTTIVLRFVH